MGDVRTISPRRGDVDQEASDYISNAQRELDMIGGAVRVALLMADPEKDGPSAEDVCHFLDLLNDHLEVLADQLNGAQHTLRTASELVPERPGPGAVDEDA